MHKIFIKTLNYHIFSDNSKMMFTDICETSHTILFYINGFIYFYYNQ